MTPFANLNALWSHALVETLVLNGVQRVVLSPGSRSTPLALAVHAHPGLDWVVALDERSAGFFALGQAIATGAPVALVCTSGTAAANYAPAVAEASLARIPLVVITADRPPRLRGVGAAQTIDQLHLYGHAVRRFHDLPLPIAEAAALRSMTAQVALSVASATQAPAGPVHLNVPFDEPLAPLPTAIPALDSLLAVLANLPHVATATPRAADEALAQVGRQLAAARRPVVIAGPGARENGGLALLAWAAALELPVIADVGADLRGSAGSSAGRPVVCSHGDAFLRGPEFADAPDCIVRVGGAPTGKGVLTYLARHVNVPTIALQPDLLGRDGDVGAALVVVGDVQDSFTRLLAQAAPHAQPERTAWLARFLAAEGAIARRIAQGTEVPDEAAALLAAAAELPVGGRLCLSNSLPVRHAETFWGGPLAAGRHAHTFRGANGIDGVTSQALGIARASGAPTLLVTGDLATFHDLGGLAQARSLETPVVILVLNNDGGGIFSLLPVAQAAPDAFEALFGTPHGLGFRHAAALYGLPYAACDDAESVGPAVREALSHPGVTLVEVACNRARTTAASTRWNERATRGLEVER